LNQPVVGGVVRIVEILLYELTLLWQTIPSARERVNVLDRKRVRETNSGAFVKAAFHEHAVPIQDVTHVGEAWTNGSSSNIVQQRENARTVRFQTAVSSGNRLCGTSRHLRMVDPRPRIALAGLAKQFVRLSYCRKH
jgi:hypothetical protein